MESTSFIPTFTSIPPRDNADGFEQNTILATGSLAIADPLIVACQYSRYAEQRINAWQASKTSLEILKQWIDQPCTTEQMHQFLEAETASDPNSEELWLRALRQLRMRIIVSIIARDLGGRANLTEVTETMTCLAEVSIQATLSCLTRKMEAQYGQPHGGTNQQPLSLQVVGMGKLGGRELNVSSDIDLIFLYEEEGETLAPKEDPNALFIKTLSNQEFFIRLSKKILFWLGEITGDGFVFRVDMRLRPNGDSGPLACSFGMLETYLLVQGREWERYAWIKGRVVSETESPSAKRMLKDLQQLITPFVYRRYLDFGVIEAIRDLHRQIRAEGKRKANQGSERHAAQNIKLGQGGIREIEFIAQAFQLMRGGQDQGLRIRPTLQVLDAAVERGLLPQEQSQQLAEAYVFLRNLEHRLQYIDDAQTHQLPISETDQAKVAGMMAYSVDAQGYQELLQTLAKFTDLVWQQFSVIFSTHDEYVAQHTDAVSFSSAASEAVWSADLVEPNQINELQAHLLSLNPALSTQQCNEILARLKAAWQTPRLKTMSSSSRQRYDRLVQQAIQHFLTKTTETTKNAKPITLGTQIEAFNRTLDFLENISRRASYLSLLTEYPLAFTRLCDTLSASRWAATYLTQHPQLLDELLLPAQTINAETAQTYWLAMRERLEERIAQAADNIEAQMDALRQAHHVETFRILLADMQGLMTVEEIGDRLSELADTLLSITLNAVWQQMPSKLKGNIETPTFSIIAYGKLGGKELGYASDLDIIFLYDDQSIDKNNNYDAAELYASYARKVIFWLTTHTPAGSLFDIDTRLRPNGEAGLLVTSLKSFQRYQLREGDNTAWIWEHQALSRARFSAGDVNLGEAFEGIRHQVLTQERDDLANETLRTEIIAMREKMLAGHSNSSDLFDVKHDRGGMVDIEFIVQYLVLRYAAQYPALCRNAGNIALLGIAADVGLLDKTLAAQVADAYRQFRAMQHAQRLDGIERARVSPEKIDAQRKAVLQCWDDVLLR